MGRMRKSGKRRIVLILCLAALLLVSCGAGQTAQQSGGEDKTEEAQKNSGEEKIEEREQDSGEEKAQMAQQDSGKDKTEMTEAPKAEETPAEEGGTSAADEGTETAAQTELPAEDAAQAAQTLSILGDSISTFEGWIPEGNSVFYPQNGAVKEVSQTWWKLVLDEMGLTLCTNGSSSGSACFGYSQEEDPMFGCSDYRIAQLAGDGGEAPDIILVYMGTNDVLMSAAIGDNDGRRAVEEGMVGNFSDGYTMILDKIAKRYPAAQIYCCTLLPVGNWGSTESQPFVPLVNGQEATSEAYSAQIRLIAQNRGLPVIDLEKCGITLENMAQTTADGVHPTPEGMRLIADTVRKSLTK